MAPDCKGCTKWRSVLILTAVIVGTARGYEESYTISQISPKSAIDVAKLDLEASQNPTLQNYIVLETSETDQLMNIEPSSSVISQISDVIQSDTLENEIGKTHHRIVERSAAPIMPHRQSRSIQFDELASSRNQITEYDSNDVEVLNKQRYYNQIQPTKTLDHINDVLDEEIESSSISFGTRMPGEAKGVPRGRAIPLQGPRSRMSAGPMISATVSPNIESVGRQQNPDIQDIITGIVKLLNGNVNVQANTQLPGRPLRPMSSRINNRGPPRISDVPPLPPDFDSGLQAQHPTKIPPPYPFDRPPLPDQPPAMKPFLNGVTLPEQLVPLPSNTNYRPGNFHSTRPNIPPWQRPRPRPTGNRRPNPNLPMYKPSPPSILQELPAYNEDLYTTKPTTDLLDSDEIYNGHGINNITNANNADITTESNFSTNESTSFNSNEDVSNELNDTASTNTTIQIINTTSTMSTLLDENVTVSNLDDAVTNSDKIATTTSTTTEKNVKTDKPSKSEIFKDNDKKKGYNNKLDKTKQDDRNKINTENADKDLIKNEKKDEKKNVTNISNDVTPALNDDAVLETSMVDSNANVETSTSSSTPVEGLPSFSATPVLNKEDIPSHSPDSSVVDSSINTSPTTTPHPSFPYLPYKPRPGIVLDDPDFKPHGRPPPVDQPAVITAEPPGTPGNLPNGYGEIFDVTVSAIQGPGGNKGGMATVHIENVNPLTGHSDGDIIVSPSGDHGFVSIEGKRTYLNLFGDDSSSVQAHPTPAIKPTPVQRLPIPTAMTGTGVAIPAPDDLPLNNPPPVRPARPQLVAANQRPGSNLGPGSRRPSHGPFNRRPQPTVRIDTCIVGDDSTCDQTQNEKCKTEVGISSCQCRPGYARRNHRDPCRRVVAMSLSLRVDRIYDRKIAWDAKLSDRETDVFQQLNFEAVRAIDSAFSMTPYSDEFVSGSVNSVYQGDPSKGAQGVFVNYTVLLEESAETLRGNVRADIQRHLLGVLQRRANNVGESALWVDSPVGSISHLQDLDECSSPDLNDCHHLASCTNVWGGFRCSCPDSTRDNWSGQPGKAGRDCMSCPASQCSNRGICSYSDNVPRCSCSSGYYGVQCEVDGEVVGVAVGASLAALLIIILTLVCLVMWSRRWSREQKSAAGMGSPVFSYMANTVKSPNMGQPPYQVSLEERLRWAQLAEAMAQANHYAQSESAPNMTATRPSSAMFGAYPTLPGPVPPVPMPRMGLHVGSGSVHHTGTMNTVTSRANTTASQGNLYGGLGGYLPHNGTESSSSDGDSHVQDRADLLGPGGGNRGFHVPRPKSRTNQSIANQSGIYYDVDYENAPDAIYGSKGIPLSTYTMGRGGPPFYRS